MVIKLADKRLQQNRLARIREKFYPCDENVVLEANVMKYLAERSKCPASIVKFCCLLENNSDYLLVMEDGGRSLFQFIVECHQLIKQGTITVAHWHQVIRVIFGQMVECIEFLHSNKVCHFDVSLENWLINDVKLAIVERASTPTQTAEVVEFDLSDIQVKLCDFGLAEIFSSNDCLSQKYCGKTNYKSPECVSKASRFDAKKNDIWCMGVCLFMMAFGTSPWHKARKRDVMYKVIVIDGAMSQVLQAWGITHLGHSKLLTLLKSIFQSEDKRPSLAAIREFKL